MGWLAGYHNTFGEYHDEIRDTWAEARMAMVTELDERITGLETDPGVNPAMDALEVDDLRAARDYFAQLEPDEEGAADASALTFVLVPDSVLLVRDAVAAEAAEVLAAFEVLR